MSISSCPKAIDHPPGEWPSLFADLVSTWGPSVGIDPASASAVILTIAGGIAGNSVQLHAPKVGVVGPNLQLAVTRDNAPDLKRGLHRLTHAFEESILEVLHPYHHLTDKRSQRNELAALETRFNATLSRLRQLDETINDERAMMNATFKQEAEQITGEHCRLKEEAANLEARLRSLRYVMRPMVLVPELGIKELDEIGSHAHDRAVLELATAPGYLRRLRCSCERSLDRLAAFRRNAEWGSRLEYAGGHYHPRSAVSTLLLTTHREMREARDDTHLVRSGVLDGMFVCNPGEPSPSPPGIADPGQAWGGWVSRMFLQRLDGPAKLVRFSGEAHAFFLSLHQETEQDSREFARLWKDSGPVLVAKLSLCASLFRNPGSKEIGEGDVKLAAWIAQRLVQDTVDHVGKGETRSTKTPQPQAARRKPVKPPNDGIGRMVGKIRKLGPCSPRTLFRTYPRQTYTELLPILERAIQLGLVKRDGKLLLLASASVAGVGAP